MRFFSLYLCYGIFALALMTTWLTSSSFPLLRIDLVLPAVSVLTLTKEWRRALPLIVFFGALVDVASFSPFGMTVVTYVGSYLLMRLIISQVSFQMGFGRLFWIGFMSFLQKSIAVLLMFFWTRDVHFLASWAPYLFAQVMIDAVVGFLLVPLLMWYGDVTLAKIFRPKGLVME